MPNPSDPFAEFDQAAADYNYTEPAAPAPAPQQAPAPAVAPVQPQAPAPVDPSLQDLLDLVQGNQPQPQNPQPQAQPQQPPADGDHGPVPYDRFRTVAEENRYLRDLVARQLAGQQQQPPAAQPAQNDGMPPGVDPEVWDVVKPIIEAERQRMLAEVGPVMEYYQRERATEMLTQTVPGFTREMMPELEALYESLPARDQDGYRGRGGAEALAYRVVLNRAGAARGPAMSPQAPARGSAMAHSLGRSGGMLPPVARPINVNQLSAQDFAALKAASERRRYGDGFDSDEPDPILDGRF